MALSAVELGFLVGLFPTACMVVVSLVLYNLSVSTIVEASFQNFAAGLILAAVAAELFPLIEQASDGETYIGVTVGFAVGYLFLVGTEPLSEYLVENYSSIRMRVKRLIFKNIDDDSKSPTYNPMVSKSIEEDNQSPTVERKKTRPKSFDGQELPETAELISNNIVWDDEGVSFASTAIEQASHKDHIKNHLIEISEEINVMQSKSVKMMDGSLSDKDSEAIAEEIDEAIHGLQYKVCLLYTSDAADE